MLNALLDDLSGEDGMARREAVVRASRLPSDSLGDLLEMYQERRSEASEALQTRRTMLTVGRWLRMLIAGYPSRVEGPETILLARLARSLNEAIALTYDPAAVGPILLLLTSRSEPGEDWELRDEACGALERLLPGLLPEHVRGWTPLHRAALSLPLERVCLHYRALDALEDRTFMRSSLLGSAPRIPRPIHRLGPRLQTVHLQAWAVLRALRQVGSESDLPLVRELSRIEPREPLALQIKQAAAECLPSLEERARQKLLARELLRPSQSTASAAGATLLRPSVETDHVTRPDELLRPSAER